MYNINKRSQFETAGDLMRLLAEIPKDAKVYITGANGWLHITEDEKVVCLDCEDLEDCYEEALI